MSDQEIRAFVVHHGDDEASREQTTIGAGDLPEGEVTVDIAYSSVNYKDALASTANGGVAKAGTLIPGIDLAGTVAEGSADGAPEGSVVLAHGYDLGVSRDGGFAERTRVPADWIVPMPEGLDPRCAMILGTAGYTAGLSVEALEHHGLEPGDGPVLVTGASGGVGSVAVALLAAHGYEVVAATGKDDSHDRLRSLGANELVDRGEVSGDSERPLESARWAGAVDPVGGATIPTILRTLRPGAAVAASGNAGGVKIATTVLPFILRGVALLGIDSVHTPIDERRKVWQRLADDLDTETIDSLLSEEVGLDGLESLLDRMLDDDSPGRAIVRLGSD